MNNNFNDNMIVIILMIMITVIVIIILILIIFSGDPDILSSTTWNICWVSAYNFITYYVDNLWVGFSCIIIKRQFGLFEKNWNISWIRSKIIKIKTSLNAGSSIRCDLMDRVCLRVVVFSSKVLSCSGFWKQKYNFW